MVEFNNPIPVICVSGPTASGKSRFAIELALKLNGEIINADSVQVYQGFDIGSGKITEEEAKGVRHHLLSHVDPHEQYSAGIFKREAFEKIREILNAGKTPIVVGGTGLYLRALFSDFLGVHDVSSASDFLFRVEEKLGAIAFANWSYHFLTCLDPEAAQRIGPADVFRLQRALALVLTYGIPNKSYREIYNQKHSEVYGLIFVIEEQRVNLYRKIDQRVQQMIDRGWIEEVRQLKAQCKSAKALQAIGYRHIFNELIFGNELESQDLSILIKNIQRDTRRFAKRQSTWWRNQPNALGWIPVAELSKKSDFNIVDPSCFKLGFKLGRGEKSNSEKSNSEINLNKNELDDSKSAQSDSCSEVEDLGSFEEVVEYSSIVSQKFISLVNRLRSEEVPQHEMRSLEAGDAGNNVYYERIAFNQNLRIS